MVLQVKSERANSFGRKATHRSPSCFIAPGCCVARSIPIDDGCAPQSAARIRADSTAAVFLCHSPCLYFRLSIPSFPSVSFSKLYSSSRHLLDADQKAPLGIHTRSSMSVRTRIDRAPSITSGSPLKRMAEKKLSRRRPIFSRREIKSRGGAGR